MSAEVCHAADTFDYVIVGAGAAGSILANRLTEDAGTTVCLLEAGPRDWHPYLHIPSGFIKAIFNPAFTWQFSSEPTDQTNGRRVPIPQRRTLGGSTSINGLAYTRGHPADYDGWAAAGNGGWAYDDVLAYFKRSERKIGPGDDDYHGRAGEQIVTNMDWIHPVCEAFIAGAAGAGIPRTATTTAHSRKAPAIISAPSTTDGDRARLGHSWSQSRAGVNWRSGSMPARPASCWRADAQVVSVMPGVANAMDHARCTRAGR